MTPECSIRMMKPQTIGVRLHATMTAVVAAMLLFGEWVSRASACDDLTVRDAAFQEARDIHRLCVMARSGDPLGQDIFTELQHWLSTDGHQLNVELMRADVDDPDVDWAEFGIPSAPPSAPAVVLAGHHAADERTFFVDVWEPGPEPAELALMATSPAREAIRERVLRHVAVLLHVPGGGDAGHNTDKTLQNVVEAWSKNTPLGLSIVRVDRADPQERVLLSFIGVKPEGPAWVAVVFGPGKLMAPLAGDEITETAIHDQIASLTAACTCLQTPSRLGVDLPMAWDESLNASLVALATPNDDSNDRAESISAGSGGVAPRDGTGVVTATGWTVLAPTLVVVAILGVASIVATIAVFWRKGRRTPAPLEN